MRSAKEKQWTALQKVIKTMVNHRKIEDFSQVQEGNGFAENEGICMQLIVFRYHESVFFDD